MDETGYDAATFERLEVGELGAKRRSLICPECHAPAYFRKSSRNGVGACFGANPHAPTCQLAGTGTTEHPGEKREIRGERFNPGDRIVLDDALAPGREDHAVPGAAPSTNVVLRQRRL